jgi:hypothetical protein
MASLLCAVAQGRGDADLSCMNATKGYYCCDTDYSSPHVDELGLRPVVGKMIAVSVLPSVAITSAWSDTQGHYMRHRDLRDAVRLACLMAVEGRSNMVSRQPPVTRSCFRCGCPTFFNPSRAAQPPNTKHCHPQSDIAS